MFGSTRHEIDRLQRESIEQINRVRQSYDNQASLRREDLEEALVRIRHIVNRAFEDVVSNLDHLENSILEVVATAYVKGQMERG